MKVSYFFPLKIFPMLFAASLRSLDTLRMGLAVLAAAAFFLLGRLVTDRLLDFLLAVLAGMALHGTSPFL